MPDKLHRTHSNMTNAPMSKWFIYLVAIMNGSLWDYRFWKDRLYDVNETGNLFKR